MTDVVQTVEADASKVVAGAKADAVKIETAVSKDVAVVKTDWTTKVKPYLTHALAVAVGYVTADWSSVLAWFVKLI